MIDIIIDEPLIKHIDDFDGILIGTNCYQVMRNGFQYEVTKKYPQIKELNYSTKYGDKSKLGDIAVIDKFYLMFVSFGYNFKGKDEPFIDYDALTKCLRLINLTCKGKHFATTMIGCTRFDGNADKQKVLDIINKEITNLDLSIFDYRQESGNTYHQRKYLQSKKKNCNF